MYGLISCLYDEKKQKALESLYNNSDINDQFLIRSVISEALKDCPRILESHGTDFILCTLASYHKSDSDTVRVFQSIMKMFDGIDFGLLTEKIKWKSLNVIADECLVGVGFFRKRMDEMYKRHAAPSSEYYSKVGSAAFNRLGYEKISENFSGWTDFIEKELAVTSIIN